MTGEVRALSAAEAEARLAELADLLVDAVAQGASVNFLAGFTAAQAMAFVVDDGGLLLATVVLSYAPQPNAAHRAEIGKMLVRSSARRRGLGRRLLAAAEAAARDAGRTLLMLDTESGSAGDLLYRGCGWIEAGRVPDHARRPNGELAETTLFYKRL
jgi:GNAT superfamily N-acetyltransferase